MVRQRLSTGVRAGLVLAVGSSLLPILGVLWATAYASDAVERQVFGGQQAAVSALLDRIDVAHDAAIRAAIGAADRPGLTRAVVARDREEIRRVLANVFELAPFRTLEVFDTGGALLVAAPDASASVPVNTTPGDPVVSRPTVEDGAAIVTVRAPFRSDGVVVGQFRARIPFRDLAGGDAGLALGDNISVTILESDGTILASVLPDSEGQKVLAPEALRLITRNRPGTASYYAPRFGYTVLSTFVPSTNDRHWHALAVSRHSIAMADATTLARRLWLGGAALVAGLLALVALVARYVARAETSLHVIQTELTDRNADLEAANTGLASFANAAAHDLRSPLQTILGFTGLLADTEADHLTDAGRNALAAIDRQTNRLTALVDALLDYARAGSTPLHRQHINPAGLVQDILERLAALRDERGAEIYLGDLPDAVDGDPDLLTQVLQNIIANAILYSDPQHPVVRIDGDEKEPFVRIRVSDNGSGVAEDERGAIFEMLRRGSAGAQRGGTGIGLAMAARIVERHNGRLTVDDAPSGGACFTVELPAGRATNDPNPAPVR